MFRIAFALLTAFQSGPEPVPQDEIRGALAHAEALYYGARFSESITLLARIDDALQAESGRLQEKIDTKLRLALAHIGLNDTEKARSYLSDLYVMDSTYAFDSRQFPPKVIALADEARAEQIQIRCHAAKEKAQSLRSAGDTAAFIELLRSSRSTCTALAAMELEATESFYRTGLAEFRRDDMSAALSSFETAQRISPEHELASQYIDLVRSKLQVTQDRLLLQWQRDFDARDFAAAALDYRKMMSSQNGRDAAAIDHSTGEYRKALSALVETWNRTCPGGDTAALNAIRGQISDLLPDSSFGEEIRAQMSACPDMSKSESTNAPSDVQIAAAVEPEAGAAAGVIARAPDTCVEANSQVVLARLKSRVDPAIRNNVLHFLRPNGQIVIRVKARISQDGGVTVTGIAEGNPMFNDAVASAVAAWKFAPMRDAGGPRCVDTEIPIVVRLAQ